LTVAEGLNDVLSLAMATYWFGWGLTLDCAYEKASCCLERALEINVAASNLWGIATIKSVMSAFLYNFQGKIALGYQTSDEALRTAEESGDPYSKATAHTSHSYSYYFKGVLDEADRHSSVAREFCERSKWFSWHSMVSRLLGDICCDRGEYQKAQDYYREAISLLEGHSMMPSGANALRIALARAKVMNDEKDIDLNQIFKYYEDSRLKIYQGITSRGISEILLNIDDRHMSEAEQWVRKAIEVDKRNGMMWELASAHALYAELLKRKGDLPGAKEKLSKAIEIYGECGADGWLKKAQEDLAELQKPTRKRTKQTKG
jgi:tetratricopeptide (TPR) repeat protein